jgi:hypothetical protein
MKQAARAWIVGALCLVAQSALAQAPSAPDAHAAHGHKHAHAADAALSLNAGEPWQTDEALRRGMLQIRVASAMLTPAFEAAQLSQPQAAQLAEAVRLTVNTMIAECQLPADADANLHLILGRLLAAAEALETASLAAEGLPAIQAALQDYGHYFAHPGWHDAPAEDEHAHH